MALASSISSLSSLTHRSQSSGEEDHWPLHGYVASGIELLDDRDLIILVKDGDQGKRQEALTAIFNRYCDRLRGYFLGNQGVDRSDVDELWAETWTRAFGKICRSTYEYQEDKTILAYLYGIANLVLLEYYKREKKKRMGLEKVFLNQQQQERETWDAYWRGEAEVKEDGNIQAGRKTNGEDDDPSEIEPSVARDRKLHEALSGLSPRRRDIILLTYFRGMNSEEVAVEIGMKGDAVRKDLSRAYEALRELLGSRGAKDKS